MENKVEDTNWTQLERTIKQALEDYAEESELAYWVTVRIDDDGLFKDTEDAYDYISTMTEVVQLTINKFKTFYALSDSPDISLAVVIAERLRRMNVIDEDMDV